MSYFCHFDVFLRSGAGAGQRTAIVFTSAKSIVPKTAADELKRIFATAYTPSRTIFIGLEDCVKDLREFLNSDDARHVHLPFEKSSTKLYFFGANGHLYTGKSSPRSIERDEEESIRRQGMTAIFVRRGGVMSAGESYHYVKPSGGHSVKFLRPGNVVRFGQEVAFMAVWLVRHFHKHTPFVYADTASITQIAYSACEMAKRLGVCETDPSINSFGSYSGLDDESWGVPHNSVVLISASTSGSLKDRLVEAGADPTSVITMFSTSGGDALCNLVFDDELNRCGIERIKTYNRSSCPACAAGSLPILIAGDSFLPETPEPRLRLVRRTDQPKWHEVFLGLLEGKRVTSCFRPGAEGANYPLYFDLAPLCIPTQYLKHFEFPLTRLLNLGVDAIVHLVDSASIALAKRARAHYTKCLGPRAPELCSVDERLDQKLIDLRNDKGRSLSVVVVASCVAGGFTLLSVSRSLRNHTSRISYFVGLAIPPNSGAWSQLKSNLEHRNDGVGKNMVEVVWQGSAPQLGFGQPCPWTKELNWLEARGDLITSTLLLERRTILDSQARRTSGLTDAAFLPAPSGGALVLNRNFAFHKCRSGTNLSQSDVFMVVSTMLHGLRDLKQKDGLGQSMNCHVLLDPSNFDRYNDGVIQAALLRSAQASELAYSTHPLASRSISSLIERMINLHDQSEGEALPEFALALLTGRMTVTSTDFKLLKKKFVETLAGHPYMGDFSTAIEVMHSE